MLSSRSFTFNPFSENTYVLWDETKECIIIDPGCYTTEEKSNLEEFITAQQLKPVKILMTHAHIDHMLGNNFLTGRYGLDIQLSFIEKELLRRADVYGEMWGIRAEASPPPLHDIIEGEEIKFGSTILKAFFTPGHSPGSFSFYHAPSKAVFAGDALFYRSIGRTDLPGGDTETLLESIRTKLFALPDETTVYSGHGPQTLIGDEKANNPFLQ